MIFKIQIFKIQFFYCNTYKCYKNKVFVMEFKYYVYIHICTLTCKCLFIIYATYYVNIVYTPMYVAILIYSKERNAIFKNI